MMHALFAAQHYVPRWFSDLNFRGPGLATHADHTDWLFFWIFLISAFFFVLLMGLMFYFMFKYRKRPGAVPVRSRSHNTFLELSWSVIPTILLVWMFFEGFWGYANAVVAPASAPELVVTGQRWSWSLTYPNGAQSPETKRLGAMDQPVFVVPENQPVQLRMSSSDVLHAFWIPDFRVKFDVFPNRYSTIWFQSKPIDKSRGSPLMRKIRDDRGNVVREEPWTGPGGEPYYFTDHYVFCAEYCGANHSEMIATLRVVPVDAYEEILADWAEPKGDPITVGRLLAQMNGCFACHAEDQRKVVGPGWGNMYGYERTLTSGQTVIADANYLRNAILNPGAEIVEGYPNQMPTYQGKINDNQLNSIITYLQSLSDRGPARPLPDEEHTPPEGVPPSAPAHTPGPGPVDPPLPSTGQQPPR
jgi:cytochrome c oxidase subunit II